MPSIALFETPGSFVASDTENATYNHFIAECKTYILSSRTPQEAKARALDCERQAVGIGLSTVLVGKAILVIRSYLNQYHILQGRVGQRTVSDEALIGGLVVGGVALIALGIYMVS